MVDANMKGVNRVKKVLADGTVRYYFYHRATGRALRGDPSTLAFLEDYATAERSLEERKTQVFAQLVRDYLLSPETELLAASTQKEYRRLLMKTEERFGTLPIAALDDPRIRQEFTKWRADIYRVSGAREADNRLTVTSAVLSWARNNGYIHSNHLAGFRRLYRSDRSDKIWLPEHIEAFMKAAPLEMRQAMMLALHTGQRQGDLLKMSWTNYNGSEISLLQSKSKRAMCLPCTSALKKMLDTMERKSPLILTTKTGVAWTSDHFKSRWSAACKKAGITGLHFHDLRGTAVTLLAEAECTTAQIATITGHSLDSVSSILDRYLARTKVLASQAMTLLENSASSEHIHRMMNDESGMEGVGKSSPNTDSLDSGAEAGSEQPDMPGHAPNTAMRSRMSADLEGR